MSAERVPSDVAGFVHRLTILERSPAFLLLDAAGVVTSCGGSLSLYGLGHVWPGVQAVARIDFLVGLLPVPEAPLLVRLLGTPSGRVADLHMFGADAGGWVLLLDAAAEAETLQGRMQKTNELQLSHERELALLDQLQTTNRELETRGNRLTELVAEKDTLLGTAAHDLRNPLGTIKVAASFLMTLGAGELSPRARRLTEYTRNSSDFMARLVDNMLDFSTGVSGKLHLDYKLTNLAQITHATAALNQIYAEQKGISLMVDVSDRLPEVMVDPLKIEQVITNLLSNAIKFSPRGSRVSVTVKSGPDQLRIAVRDQGEGIPPDELQHVFEPFQKGSSRPTGGERGTGLGLAICKRIVDGHRGQLQVESGNGQGTLFTLTLPLSSPDLADPTGSSDPAGQ
jgi:signal transduction histidine kinase